MGSQAAIRCAVPSKLRRSPTTKLWAALVACSLQAAVGRAGSADDAYALAAGHYARGQWQLAAEAFAAFVAKHPEHRRGSQALFYRAEALVQLNDLSAAREVFQTYLERAPQDGYTVQARFRAAEAAMLLGDRDPAIKELEGLVDEFPEEKLLAFALPYLGDMTLAQGHPATAQQFYQRALKQFPSGPLADDCRLGLARAAIKQRQFAMARPLLTELAERDGGALADDAQLELAQLEYGAGDDEACGAACALLVKRFPTSPLVSKAHRTHAWSLFRRQRYAEALAKFESLKDDSSLGLEARYWLALCQRGLNEWRQAADTLQPLLAKLDGQAWEEGAWFHAGDSLIRAGQTDSGREILAQAQQRWPGGAWSDDASETVIRSSLETAAYDEALVLADAYDQSFDNAAGRHRVARMRAQALIALKQFDTAATVLETVLAQARGPLDSDAARDGDPLAEPHAETPLDLSVDRYLLSVAYAGAGRQTEAAELAANVSQDASGPLGAEAQLIRAAALAALGNYSEALAPLEAYLTVRPDGVAAGRCRGEISLCHARLGHWDQAREAFARLVDLHPAHETLGPIAEQLAELARLGNQRDWANELYERCSADDQPTARRARGMFGMAWCERQAGHLADARLGLQRLLAAHPESEVAADAALTLGGLCEQLDEPDAALAAYNRVIARPADCPQRPDALLATAAIHDRLHQDRSAAQRYRDFLNDYPGHHRREAALYQLAWSLRNSAQSAAADEALGQLRLEFPRGKYALDAAYRLAEQAFAAREFASARQLLQDVLMAPDAGTVAQHAWYLAGRIAVAQGEWTDAQAAMRTLAEKFPDGPLTQQAEYWQGEALFRQNEFSAAAERLDALRRRTADRAEPWLALVHLRLAHCLAHLQKWPEARQAAAAIAERFPGFEQQHEADYLLGRSLAAAAEFDAARAAYQRVLEAPAAAKTETAAQAQLMLAETYFHQRDYAAAAREYLAVEILYAFPELQAAALWQAGKCYEQLRQPADAARVYQRLVEAFPDCPYAAEAHQRQTELTAATDNPLRTSR